MLQWVNNVVLAGTPRSSLPLTQIIDQACQEAEIYKDAGVVSFGFLLPMAAFTQSCFCISQYFELSPSDLEFIKYILSHRVQKDI